MKDTIALSRYGMIIITLWLSFYRKSLSFLPTLPLVGVHRILILYNETQRRLYKMNQIEIGKFIAVRRKAHGMTQSN